MRPLQRRLQVDCGHRIAIAKYVVSPQVFRRWIGRSFAWFGLRPTKSLGQQERHRFVQITLWDNDVEVARLPDPQIAVSPATQDGPFKRNRWNSTVLKSTQQLQQFLSFIH